VITHICSNGEEICDQGGFVSPEWKLMTKIFVRSFLIKASSFWLILVSSVSASAQTISESQMRAASIARMQAELTNGGGSQYSPANCVHQGGGETCMISNTADGFASPS
jgi:hypothetical protein